MTTFRSKLEPQRASGYPKRSELWIENIAPVELTVMLEPWCTTVEVPPKQWARLEGTLENENEEYHVQYDPANYLGVYCPPDTTIEVIAERWKKP